MLKILSLFSGIGAFEKALERLNIEHKVLAYCEIDKQASKAYSIIHGVSEDKNLCDVATVDIWAVDELVDLITYGFPCQDISVAGTQVGFSDDEGNLTRSGLFFEALRIIDEHRPKFAIAENVKALTSKRFSDEFETVLRSLEGIGYHNYWAVLNAKDYGIPQNRERVFIISIREDVDKGFIFPNPIPLTVTVRSFLDATVDERFYLSDAFYERIKNTPSPKPQYREETLQIGSRKYLEEFAIGDYRYDEGFRIRKNGLCPTLTTLTGQRLSNAVLIWDRSRLRYLTHVESFRLMGFDEEDCEKCFERGITDVQLRVKAGNSIVVNVLEAIFSKLGETYEEFASQ